MNITASERLQQAITTHARPTRWTAVLDSYDRDTATAVITPVVDGRVTSARVPLPVSKALAVVDAALQPGAIVVVERLTGRQRVVVDVADRPLMTPIAPVAPDRVDVGTPTHSLTFTATTVSGQVGWGGGSAVSSGVVYAVSPGVASDRYLYWTPGTGQITGRVQGPQATDTDTLVVINLSGNPWRVPLGAVHGETIVSGSLTSATYGSGSVTSGAIAASAVTAAAIADGSITSSKIAAGAVDTTALGASAVTAAKIAAGAVGTAALAAGAVDTNALGAAAVTSAKIATDAVTAAAIIAGAVGTSELADGGVTTVKIATGAVTTNELGAGVVTSAKIAANAVGAGQFVLDGSGHTAGYVTRTVLDSGGSPVSITYWGTV